MVLAGSYLSVLGFRLWGVIGGYEGLLPGMFGLLFFLLGLFGGLYLLKRNSLAITIDESGIEMPAFNLILFRWPPRRVLIPRQEIIEVSKAETLKGRLIEIRTRRGEIVSVQARHYCSLDQFLSHCREYGLPVV
jgi:hypothetical protein